MVMTVGSEVSFHAAVRNQPHQHDEHPDWKAEAAPISKAPGRVFRNPGRKSVQELQEKLAG
jgi:hypothetical protein